MLNELVGKKNAYALMGHAASELAVACQRGLETDILDTFTKICAYGMDLKLTPSKESIKAVIDEVFDKMGAEHTERFMTAIKKELEEETKNDGME